MPRLSFLTPAKDVAPFIGEMVRSLQTQAFRDWELVVVDDHSMDGTLALLENEAARDPRLRVLRNPGRGIVQALNHGFGACSGRWLKFVDSDDFLPGSFSEHLDRLKAEEATYHDAYLLQAGKPGLRRFRMGPRFAAMDLEESLRRIMISPPRWSWTFSREIAERIFPLPTDLPSPHEDVYLGLKIKQNSRVAYVPLPLYVYRERPGQTYGGLFNFSPGVVIWRAKAMLRVIELIKAAGVTGAGENIKDILAPGEIYYRLLAEDRVSATKILGADLQARDKLRVLLIRKAPALASFLSRRRASSRRS